MRLLNLGCGTKTSPDAINIDWSIYLSIRKNPLLRTAAPLFLNKQRLRQLRSLDHNIVVHDLRKGLPFADDSIDAVYHSHVLEHIDRDLVPGFFAEIRRVLVPGGYHRVAVPDMEFLCRDYLDHLERAGGNPQLADEHEDHLAAIIEQMVRKRAHGTSRQPPPIRWIENLVLGDARRRGETHQWMYDRISLARLLEECGFRDVQVRRFNESRIPQWGSHRLEVDADGGEYKPHSLYIEAVKP